MKVYRLSHDYNHSGDTEVDASRFGCTETDNHVFDFKMMGVSELDLPELMYFHANFDLIPQYDFPLTDLITPIFSKRMLSIIKSLGHFRHREVEIIMMADTYLDYPFDPHGELKPDVPINRDYVAVQLMEYTDAFNFNTSEYTADPNRPDRARMIRKLVLREPAGGFPPIFKIKQKASSLLITERTRETFEANNIIGCVYTEVIVSDA